jgi:hypothetical protein
MTLDQAVTLLNTRCKHWRLQVENGDKRRYSCKVWGEGRRFEVERATPFEAVHAALDRLIGISEPQLRIAR